MFFLKKKYVVKDLYVGILGYVTSKSDMLHIERKINKFLFLR